MPAVLTHDFFGRDALVEATKVLGFSSDDEREAFLLGNQGPDPLLYLIVAPWVDKRDRVGGLMHHERPAHLLASLHEAIDMLAPTELAVGKAYAVGFLCHYLLDSTMHPFVFSQQYAICDAGIEGLDRSNGSRVHQEIERDLDEMVLYTKTHETIRTYRPYREVLAASDDVLAAIDKLYFYTNLWTYSRAIGLDTFTQGVRSFRLMQRVFWMPESAKGRMLTRVEHLVAKGPYSQYAAMAHRVRAEATSAFDNREHHVWENPFTGEQTTESFWDLFEDAQSRVFDAIELFSSKDFGIEEARELTGGLNFSGCPMDEDEPLGSYRE